MPSRLAILLFLAVTIAGCRRETIRVYTAPKDAPSVVAHGEQEGREPPRNRPQLTWTLPQGWRQTDPGQVSVANFVIDADAGQASVNITPLPNLAGREAMVVNMWREQLGQPPLPEEEVTAALTPVEVSGESGQLFEIDDGRRRIVTALLHRPDASWFF
jgi:hypothetical protein